MEEKSSTNKKETKSQNKGNEGEIEMKDGGNLAFGEAECPEHIFSHPYSKAELIVQRTHNHKLILAHHKNHFKIYRITDKHKIEFVSAHTVHLPVKGSITKTVITEKHIRLYFSKYALDSEKENKKFLKQKRLKMTKISCLVFEFEYGINQPQDLTPKIFIEKNSGYKGLGTWMISELVTNEKPLYEANQCLIIAANRMLPSFTDIIKSKPKEAYLAKLDKDYEGQLPKRVFRFNKSFENLEKYKTKLWQDYDSLSEVFRESLKLCFRHKPSPLTVLSSPLGSPHQLNAALSFDREMFSVQLFDPRTKKIQSRTFVSIYELFQGQKFVKVSRCNFIQIYNMVYSPEVDALCVEIGIKLGYLDPEEEHLTSIINSELKVGRFDRSNLTNFVRVGDHLLEGKTLRFKVHHVFRVDSRTVTVERIASSTNFSTRRIWKGILSYAEFPSEIKLEVITRDGRGRESDGEESTRSEGKGRLSGNKTRKILRLKKGSEFPDTQIKKILMLEDNIILVVGFTQLILLDLESKKVLSSLNYSLGIPTIEGSDYLVEEDLMVFKNPNNAHRCIEISKVNLNQEKGFAPAEHIATVDLSQFEPLHSIKKLIGLRKLDDDSYDLKLFVNWMLSEETTLFNKRAFWVRFRLTKDPGALRGYAAEVINGHLDLTNEYGNRQNLFTYHKRENWYEIHRVGSRVKFFHSKTPFGLHSGPQPELTKVGEIEADEIVTEAHMKDRRAYLAMKSKKKPTSLIYDQAEIRILEFQQFSEEGKMTEPKLIKSIKFEGRSDFFFDKKTEKLRIFYISYQKEGASLVILDEGLEVVSRMFIRNVTEFYVARAISEDYIFLVGYKKGRSSNKKVDVSMLVDLSSKTVKEIVSQSGRCLGCDPHLCSGNRLITLVKYMFKGGYANLDGFLVSDLIE